MTPFLGTFDVVTVPVHPNVRDAACASDDTISTDTSADSSRDVCDPVSKLPLVHARIYLVPVLAPMAWLRQLGDILRWCRRRAGRHTSRSVLFGQRFA